ncbi:hypothetical protein LCGC14_2642620 [marine sediment metagenome]|uniref:Uncharacterized protein n=1 Tax=marine sediment metagenome TaxID=412755 RepID=A0A0F8ZX21_9ZZZZ
MNILQQIKDNVMEKEKIFIQTGRRCGKDYLALLTVLKRLGMIESLNVMNEFIVKEL